MQSHCYLVTVLLILDAAFLVMPRKSSGSRSMFGTGNVYRGMASDERRRQFFLDHTTQPVKIRPNRWRHSGGTFSKESKSKKILPLKERKPNIILILTDDQDVELGSMNYMPKALRILRDGGVNFSNAFVTTPMCCPSRSSILTGMYVHNHHTFTNNDNCSSPYWQQTHESRSFATYLNNAGYRTGYFGKYLNEYNGTYIPPGWREWAGLIRNSRFYNYTINRNGLKMKYENDYSKDYYPDLITNDSISFLRQSKQLFINKPVMMVLSYPSPHGPEDAAPQYQHLFVNETTHRTPTYNLAPNLDKQWILRKVGPMEPIHIKFTDALHRKRLQTLQSVDEALERLYNELKHLGELNNTYIFYTSDHGYHLGQFGLVKGKAMPFDFDIKVPFFVRGPNVPQGISIPNIVLNLDLAPTFLDIGGVVVPEHMDGKSIMKLILGANEFSSDDKVNVEKRMLKKRTWRDTFLVESAGRQNANLEKKLNGQPGRQASKTPVTINGLSLKQRCLSPEYRTPCQPGQKWECVHVGKRLAIQRCRPVKHVEQPINSNCICPENTPSSAKLDPHERRRQRAFLRDHVTKDFKPQFIGSRSRRSSYEFDLNGVYQLFEILTLKQENPGLEVIDYLYKNSSDFRKTTRSVRHQQNMSSGCHLTNNNNVNCSHEVYNDIGAWRENKNFVDNQIKVLKEKLGELKDIRKHLKQKRPEDAIFNRRNKPSHFVPVTGLDSDYDNGGDEDDNIPDSLDDDCNCDTRPFGTNLEFQHLQKGHRRGNRRDEPREERRRLKVERERQWQEKVKRQHRKSRRQQKYENYTCNTEKMNCFVHDNDHWKTPPYWTGGPFCFCQNSNNNTYWCLRTLNSTHNFLFCEFVTGFLSFYDMNKDPYQMHNVIQDIPFPILYQLHHQLMLLRVCAGTRDCTVGTRMKGGFADSLKPTLLNSFGQGTRRGRQTSSLLGNQQNKDTSLLEDGYTDDSAYTDTFENYKEEEDIIPSTSGFDYLTGDEV